MTKTLNDFIQILKTQNPSLTKGNDGNIVTLSKTEYEAVILDWATYRHNEQTVIEAAQAVELAKVSAASKLAALGLTTDDLKALGL